MFDLLIDIRPYLFNTDKSSVAVSPQFNCEIKKKCYV